MISNLRSKPIEGHVTDSAGNILRNSQIVIKQQSPNGSFIVDSIRSDDAGYFISNPVPNGTYDIYESGIKISRIIHDTGMQGIQCFQADTENYNSSIMKNFSDMSSANTLNQFKAFIQIESPDMNTSQSGSLFPIYEKDVSVNPEPYFTNEIYKIAEFFGLTSSSRITISRFDVEYFSPLTLSSTSFKRIKWAGVPAIRFYGDSKLVLPLDYYSIVANNPKAISPAGETDLNNNVSCTFSTPNTILNISDKPGYSNLTTLVDSLFIGDILKIRFTNNSGSTTTTPPPAQWKYWYGIVDNINNISGNTTIVLENWKSSRFVSDTIDTSSFYADKIFAFDGMFSNIMRISQEINQLFNVTENNYAQNNESELYTYINQS